MSKGIAVNAGLNFIDEAVYGTNGELKGCVNDAKAMQAIASSQGFETALILNEEATHKRIVSEITSASENLLSGDMFLLTLACHGSQIPSVDGDDDEIDGLDETWVLFDQQLIDDELNSLFAKFRAGVKILVISDSCHSGTMTRVFQEFLKSQSSQTILQDFVSDFKPGTLRTSRSFEPKINSPHGADVQNELRALKRDFSDLEFIKHKNVYRAIQEELKSSLSKNSVKASVILLSGCQDNQLSADGINNGLFTETLLKIWSDSYQGNYVTLFKEIRGNMPPWQTPNFYKVGSDDPEFEYQKPFAIVQTTPSKEKENFMPTNTASISANDSRFLETLAAAAASAAVSALIQEFASSDRGLSFGGGFQTPIGGGGFNFSARELIRERLAKEGIIANRSLSPSLADRSFFEKLAEKIGEKLVDVILEEF